MRGGESVRFNINAHCFAVEPSGWRFVPRVNSLSSLFRRFAPSVSPRVHQKTTATAVIFVYEGGESVRFNINAHCFAVEPSGWRFVPRVNSLSSLFRRFAPSVSPRVHQITTATAVVFVYGGGEPLCCPQRAEGTHRAAGTSLLPKAKTSHHFFCVQDSFVFCQGKTVRDSDGFLVGLLFFVEQCFRSGRFVKDINKISLKNLYLFCFSLD